VTGGSRERVSREAVLSSRANSIASAKRQKDSFELRSWPCESPARRFYSFLLRLLLSSFLTPFFSPGCYLSSLSLFLSRFLLSQGTVSKRRGNAAGMPPANPPHAYLYNLLL